LWLQQQISGAQSSFLNTLSEETPSRFDNSLSKAELSKSIDLPKIERLRAPGGQE
jgi:hypothetical protein